MPWSEKSINNEAVVLPDGWEFLVVNSGPITLKFKFLSRMWRRLTGKSPDFTANYRFSVYVKGQVTALFASDGYTIQPIIEAEEGALVWGPQVEVRGVWQRS